MWGDRLFILIYEWANYFLIVVMDFHNLDLFQVLCILKKVFTLGTHLLGSLLYICFSLFKSLPVPLNP